MFVGVRVPLSVRVGGSIGSCTAGNILGESVLSQGLSDSLGGGALSDSRALSDSISVPWCPTGQSPPGGQTKKSGRVACLRADTSRFLRPVEQSLVDPGPPKARNLDFRPRTPAPRPYGSPRARGAAGQGKRIEENAVDSLTYPRMERDSNPRYSRYFGFQDRLFQPLRHPSLS